jgi:hypothetical protein
MAIQQNQNMVDRFLRIILGGACMLSAAYIPMPNIAVLLLMILGLYLMFSGLAGHCILYKVFGIRTCK